MNTGVQALAGKSARRHGQPAAHQRRVSAAPGETPGNRPRQRRSRARTVQGQFHCHRPMR